MEINILRNKEIPTEIKNLNDEDSLTICINFIMICTVRSTLSSEYKLCTSIEWLWQTYFFLPKDPWGATMQEWPAEEACSVTSSST